MTMESLPRVRRLKLDCAGGLLIILSTLLLAAAPSHAEIRIIAPVRTCDVGARELRRRYSMSFPAESQEDTLRAVLERGTFDRAHCLEAETRFDEQLNRRMGEIKAAEADIAKFSNRYPTCGARVAPERTSLAVVSYPIGIDGKLFGDYAMINLFATKGDSPEQFHRLILHEWIHGFKTQRVDEPDDISNLLFFEGQATFGVMKVSGELSSMSIASSLDFDPRRWTQALSLMCRIPWTAKRLNGLIPELFTGNNAAFAQPRMGYFLGAKVIERLDRLRSWCEIDLPFFRQHYEEILDGLRSEYCAANGGD